MPSSSFFTVEPHDLATAGEETVVNELTIEGAPIPLGGLSQLNARGRTFRSTLHPLLAEGQVWITEKLVNARTQSSFIVTKLALYPLTNALRCVGRQHISPS
jgi:hypothetical protein